MLSYLPFSLRNVESSDDAKKANALPIFDNARAAEGKEAMENLEKTNAYSVLEINIGIDH